MKLNRLVFVLLIFCCACNSLLLETNKINQSILKDKYSQANNGILISCIRCGCVDDYFRQTKTKIPIFIDTKCNRKTFDSFYYFAQASLDSLYEDNYNAILFKDLKTNKKASFLLLKTDNSVDFAKIIENFFRDTSSTS